ncbi:MAG: AMP-binding protein [Pseudomonadota bacterium]
MAERGSAKHRDTFPKLLNENARAHGGRPANREKEFGIWQTWTWTQVRAETRSLAAGLLKLGVRPGDCVAIVGSNRPRLYWSFVAIQMCGAVPVPVYADSVAEEMKYVFDHAEVRFAIVEDQEQVDKVLSVKDELPRLEHIVYSDARGLRNYDHSHLHPFSQVQDIGRANAAELEPKLDAIIAEQTGDDTCVMLYTSGTTGKPKGVVLTNDNILKTCQGSVDFDKLKSTDEILSYLPLAWVGDFCYSMGQAYITGYCCSCPESPETMMADLKEIGPTFFFAPPRVFEQLLTTITIRMEDAGWLKRTLFKYFMEHARRVGRDILDKKPVSGVDRFLYSIGETTVYGPLRNALGMSRARIAYTAGEAIGPEIFKFYRSIGVNLKQFYGQTEASPFITLQPDGEVGADTVGVPAPGVEIKIADNGEVMYRSPGVFKEYFKNPESTASTKTPDGWVLTGDAGFFEEGTGHLRIIDRAKDVGKLNDGSLFAPKYVENKLKFFPNIQEAVVFGHERDCVAAFLNIDLTAVGNWAERNNISYASYQELAGHPRVYEMMAAHIAETNRSLASDPMLSGCQIKRFLVLHKELDADDGELTRTRKVRRRIISERYEPLIEALYSGADSVFAETEVTYEDGRKGKISATLRIADAEMFDTAAPGAESRQAA